MNNETLLLGAVVVVGAGAAAWWWWLNDERAAYDAAPVPAPPAPPLVQSGPRLIATGDGSLYASAAETRKGFDVLYDDSHCDRLRRKNGKGRCALKCRRCKSKLARRKNKAIATAGMASVGTTRGALAADVLGSLGSLVQVAGSTASSFMGGGTTTAPGGAQVAQ